MRKRILIVEDNEENRRLLRDLFATTPHEILEATTGDDGVAMVESARPDLVLMDIQLPGIDGYEAMRRIRARADLPRVPIIAVTSYALSGDDRKALDAGADAYVTKPFSPRQLLAKVREYLGS
jgi:two-component system cell cycle response regulator DivK